MDRSGLVKVTQRIKYILQGCSYTEHARIDVRQRRRTSSSPATTQSVTCEFYGSYGSAEVHQTVYPIHKNRTIVAFAWRPDQTAVASATNPELRGNVQVLTYNPSVTRGDADTYSVEFTSADSTGLAFFTT